MLPYTRYFPHGHKCKVSIRSKLSDIPILVDTFGPHQDIKTIPQSLPLKICVCVWNKGFTDVWGFFSNSLDSLFWTGVDLSMLLQRLLMMENHPCLQPDNTWMCLKTFLNDREYSGSVNKQLVIMFLSSTICDAGLESSQLSFALNGLSIILFYSRLVLLVSIKSCGNGD